MNYKIYIRKAFKSILKWSKFSRKRVKLCFGGCDEKSNVWELISFNINKIFNIYNIDNIFKIEYII